MTQEEGRYMKNVGALPNHLTCLNRRDHFFDTPQPPEALGFAEIDNYDYRTDVDSYR